MNDLWLALAALATVVIPLALAGWLLGRQRRDTPEPRGPRGKMPADEER